MPTSVGIDRRRNEDYSWDGMKRGNTPFVVIQHSFSGTGHLKYEGHDFKITPGQTMLVPIPHSHRYYLPSGGDWSFFFLVLTGREVMRLAKEILGAEGPVLTLNQDAIDELAKICHELIQMSSLKSGTASALAYNAMTILLDQISNGPDVEQVQGNTWLSNVTDHIKVNLGATIQINDLAAIAGLSRAHFVRQFKHLTGLPPSDYVFRLRMEHAAELLQNRHLSVFEVAHQCGFNQANYFTKAFRRAFNTSPSEFRASGMYSQRPDAK